MQLINRQPQYFNRFMNIPELFKYIDYEKVKTNTLSMLATIDNIEMDDINKIQTIIDITFGLLGTDENYLSNLISRWEYNFPKSQIESYMQRIFYDATLEFWMKKQFLNGAMNWQTLNNLTTENIKRNYKNTRSSETTISDKNEIEKTGTDTFNTQNEQSNTGTNTDIESSNLANLKGASNPIKDGWERENKFFAGGTTGDNTTTEKLDTKITDNGKNENIRNLKDTSTQTGTESKKGTTESDFTKSIEQVKLNYLDKMYKFIEANAFIMERYFGAVIFSFTMPQQQPETDEFPWPWTWSNRRLVW